MADENYSYAPKYVQIQNYILQKIESGEYTAGDKISLPRPDGVYKRFFPRLPQKKEQGNGLPDPDLFLTDRL